MRSRTLPPLPANPSRRIVLAALAFLLAACGDPPAPEAPGVPPYPDERTFLQQVDRTRGWRDCFLPLVDPPFAAADDAPGMTDAEMVLGLDLGAAQACYPIQYLNHHEIVEHRLADVEVLVCWCPLCRTGAAHDRTLDGRVLRFGHSGWLWHNSYLLYDRETDSIWHHLWGTAFSGPLRGRTLRRLPVRFLSFGAWRAEFPRTLVLRKPGPEVPIDTSRDGYEKRNSGLRHGYAIDVGAASKLYRFDRLAPGGVVLDDVGGVPVAVVRDPAAATAFVYDRRVAGRVVSFDVDTSGDRPVLRERGGAGAWFLRSGTPVSGGAPGPLRLVPGSVWEEAAWALQHPAGTVHPDAAR